MDFWITGASGGRDRRRERHASTGGLVDLPVEIDVQRGAGTREEASA